jgi:hypothetical protein
MAAIPQDGSSVDLYEDIPPSCGVSVHSGSADSAPACMPTGRTASSDPARMQLPLKPLATRRSCATCDTCDTCGGSITCRDPRDVASGSSAPFVWIGRLVLTGGLLLLMIQGRALGRGSLRRRQAGRGGGIVMPNVLECSAAEDMVLYPPQIVSGGQPRQRSGERRHTVL